MAADAPSRRITSLNPESAAFRSPRASARGKPCDRMHVAMLRPSRLPALAGGVLLAAATLAAQGPLHRVLAPGAPLADPRVSSPRTLDAPATFTPAFKTRARLGGAARPPCGRQVQVAIGLWPMPERTAAKRPWSTAGSMRDGYTVEKVFFASLPGHYVSGNLYRPIGARGQAARPCSRRTATGPTAASRAAAREERPGAR